ncbi:hypothetical protein SVIOM74S_02662 [Streptomyces violarus]
MRRIISARPAAVSSASSSGRANLSSTRDSRGPAQRGQGDGRVDGDEPALGDASFQVTQGSGGQPPVGVDVAESAVAQYPHELRVGVDHPRAEPQARRDELGRVLGLPQVLVDGLTELLQRVHHRRVEELRLRREVVVEGAETHVRALRDRLDAGAGVPGVGQDLPGRTNERLAGLGTAPFEAVAGRS